MIAFSSAIRQLLLLTLIPFLFSQSWAGVTDEQLEARQVSMHGEASRGPTITPVAAQQTPRSAQRAFREFLDSCPGFEPMPQSPCEILNIREQGSVIQERYHRGWLQRAVSDPAANFSASLTHGTAAFIRNLDTLLSPASECRMTGPHSRVCSVPVTDQSEYDLFIQLLRARIASIESRTPASTLECVRACLVKCATSSLMSYHERESQNFGAFLRTRFADSPAELYSSGAGECSEIATVATDLGRRLGIPISNVSTLSHEFNQTTIRGERLSFDASSPSCLFLRDF